MDFWEWEPYYERILKDFGFSRRDDEASARLLSELLPHHRTALESLRRTLEGQLVTVLGNSLGLTQELGAAEGVIIAADEATSVAMSHGILPDIVVTDLDGKVEDILRACENGSLVVIHGHGDNREAVRRWAARFPLGTVATTQSRPIEGAYNFGGFTDGDRAVFLAEHFGAKEIRVLGFDFENPNAKDEAVDVKRRKLGWARTLIGVLQDRSVIRFPSSSS